MINNSVCEYITSVCERFRYRNRRRRSRQKEEAVSRESASACLKVVPYWNNDFVIFDFPISTFTSLSTGSIAERFFAGRYLDAAGIEHGSPLGSDRVGGDKVVNKMRANNLPGSPIKPAQPAPSAQ
jgi:hypothetical protein